jgi:hypothetical protein
MFLEGNCALTGDCALAGREKSLPPPPCGNFDHSSFMTEPKHPSSMKSFHLEHFECRWEVRRCGLAALIRNVTQEP